MELKQSERIRHQLSAPVLIVPLWKETHFLRLKKAKHITVLLYRDTQIEYIIRE